mgnify:CR=1 FL=1
MQKRKSLLKRFNTVVAVEIVSGMVWLSDDIQSLNIAVCFEILIFLSDLFLEVFFSFSSQKPHSNHVFPLLIILVS